MTASATATTKRNWGLGQEAGHVYCGIGLGHVSAHFRHAPAQAVAFSARCPHEGCQVEWREERSIYVCPCHDSSWSRDGERLGGPTRRGLDPLDVRVADGVVEVRYETFALDTSERTPVA